MTETGNFGQLDDPAFLAARRRVREQLERASEGTVTAELAARHQAMTAEFMRRARLAWQAP
jgi:hypothetical protein